MVGAQVVGDDDAVRAPEPHCIVEGAALLEQEEVSHETYNVTRDVLVTDGVRSGSVPGVRGPNIPPSSTERAVVQAMCATTPTRTMQRDGGQMGHGGPAAQAGDAERANDAESEYDVHVPKPTGEAVLKEGVWNDAVPKSHVRESTIPWICASHSHTIQAQCYYNCWEVTRRLDTFCKHVTAGGGFVNELGCIKTVKEVK